MSGRIAHRGDFSISSDLLDDHEWLTDAIIDDIGVNCKIVYPPKDSECVNCVFDYNTGRSSDIYKTGGPISFTNFSTCPVCYGVGKLYQEQTDTVKLRVYWDVKNWVEVENKIVSPDGTGQIIGYITDLVKVKRAKEIILNSNMQNIQEIRCHLLGEAAPWGFRKNRYFVAYIKRV